MSIVGNSYKEAQQKVKATKTYNDVSGKYKDLTKRAGSSFEKALSHPA